LHDVDRPIETCDRVQSGPAKEGEPFAIIRVVPRLVAVQAVAVKVFGLIDEIDGNRPRLTD